MGSRTWRFSGRRLAGEFVYAMLEDRKATDVSVVVIPGSVLVNVVANNDTWLFSRRPQGGAVLVLPDLKCTCTTEWIKGDCPQHGLHISPFEDVVARNECSEVYRGREAAKRFRGYSWRPPKHKDGNSKLAGS